MGLIIDIRYNQYDIDGLTNTYNAIFSELRFIQEKTFVKAIPSLGQDWANGRKDVIKKVDFSTGIRRHVSKKTNKILRRMEGPPILGGWSAGPPIPGTWSLGNVKPKKIEFDYELLETGSFNGFPSAVFWEIMTSALGSSKIYIYTLFSIPELSLQVSSEILSLCGDIIFKKTALLPEGYHDYHFIRKIEVDSGHYNRTRQEIIEFDINHT